MTKKEYDNEQEELLEKQLNEMEYCGYCEEPLLYGDEHDEDIEVCRQCLVKVPDEELEEMGWI